MCRSLHAHLTWQRADRSRTLPVDCSATRRASPRFTIEGLHSVKLGDLECWAPLARSPYHPATVMTQTACQTARRIVDACDDVRDARQVIPNRAGAVGAAVRAADRRRQSPA